MTLGIRRRLYDREFARGSCASALNLKKVDNPDGMRGAAAATSRKKSSESPPTPAPNVPVYLCVFRRSSNGTVPFVLQDTKLDETAHRLF